MIAARTCGGCTACCEIVPVKEIGLKAYTRCQHARDAMHVKGPGCAIYAERPYSCRSWSCLWLKTPGLPPELRPDRCGIVVDELVDLCRIDGVEVPCAQVWVARGHEEDFNKPDIRRLIVLILDKAKLDVVLWRLPPLPLVAGGGQTRARALRRRGLNVEIGAIVEASTELGEDGPRLVRANQLWDAKNG